MPYTWEQVEFKFGKEIADLMKDSTYLVGIGVLLDEKTQKAVYFNRDIRRAYNDVCYRHGLKPNVKNI